MEITDFDPAAYVRAPRLDVPGAIALGNALLAAATATPSDGEKRAIKHLRKTVAALNTQWTARDRVRTTDARPIDARVDNAWAAMQGRLEAIVRLPAGAHPGTARAAELLEVLYPHGLGFTQLEYNLQWAECDKRIKRIDTDGLAADLDPLCGPEFLACVRASHVEYGKALGITHRRSEGDADVDLSAPLRDVAGAIAAYGLQVISTIDPDPSHRDAMRFKDVRTALRPFDERRARNSRTSTPSPEPVVTAPSTDDATKTDTAG